MPDRFHQHRRDLAVRIGPHSAAFIPAAAETIRNSDVHHEFRQDSDFFYLTGFHEPDAVAVIVPGHPEGDYHLFVRPRDRELEIWNGYRAGIDGAKDHFQADAAHEIADLDSRLPSLLSGRDSIYYRVGNSDHDQRVIGLVTKARNYYARTGKAMPSAVEDLSPVLGDQRLRKTASEVESLQAACELTAQGHREAMRFTRPGLYEYQVQAAMEYVWREGGSRRNGYPSIVASGANACVLHYVENDRELEAGDLLLIDAGCEVDYFSADVTRTFPVDGRFKGPQRAIYELVLTAHRAAIGTSSPGATMRSIHDTAVRVLTEGLVDLGLLPRDVDDSIAMHHYREFFMHGTGHWLGMDVHDAGSYRIEGKPRVLEPRMSFTVEPGIYIDQREWIEFPVVEYDLDEWQERSLVEGPSARKQLDLLKENADKVRHAIPETFRGIGVRIEDDILITEDGHENMTSLAPTGIDEIEELCAEESWLQRS